MEIDIKTRDFALTEGLRMHVRRRLRTALHHFRDRVRRVIVLLSDTNGPRGGVDKRCQLLLRVDGMPDIVVADTELDLYRAISRATERASHSLSRSLRRARGALAARQGGFSPGDFA